MEATMQGYNILLYTEIYLLSPNFQGKVVCKQKILSEIFVTAVL